MSSVKDRLAVVLLGLCVAAGVAHGFLVDDDSGQFSTANDNARVDGRLVVGLKDFDVEGLGKYNGGVAGSGGGADINQFSTRDFGSASKFQKPEGAVATHEGYEKFQSGDDFEFGRSDANTESGDHFNYNLFSPLPEGSSADRQQSTATFVLGEPEKRRDARPEQAFDDRDVQGAADDQALPSKEVPAGESPPSYVYDARAGQQGGSADAAASTVADPVLPLSSDDQAGPLKGHEGPVSSYTPSSPVEGAFKFYDPRSDAQKALGSKADDDSSSAAEDSSDDTTTATTTPVNPSQLGSRGTHGCPNSYWAEHVGQWPAPLKISTLVAQAFRGASVKVNLEIVYGSTTMFQGLLDSRKDPYSKLLRHAVAALLNAHAKPAFPLRPAVVAKQFNAALASKDAAAAQAQKFENENHAFGDNECK